MRPVGYIPLNAAHRDNRNVERLSGTKNYHVPPFKFRVRHARFGKLSKLIPQLVGVDAVVTESDTKMASVPLEGADPDDFRCLRSLRFRYYAYCHEPPFPSAAATKLLTYGRSSVETNEGSTGVVSNSLSSKLASALSS